MYFRLRGWIAPMTEVGPDYWSREHPHPLAPNDDDVQTYRELIRDAKSLLLLGNTPALMPLCRAAMDTDPFLDDERLPIRVADKFPSGTDSTIRPSRTIDRVEHSFLIWDF
jgi:hypothetical protein